MIEVKHIFEHAHIKTAGDKELISRAFSFAESAHKGQTLFDAMPFFEHVYEVGNILAALEMDAKTIAAGFLHDVLEDELVSKEDLEKEFGKEITFLVEGVTKLREYRYKGVERHAESLRQFLIATSKDARVLIIRFADRLHKMRVLHNAKPERQKSVALDTLEIYAPLADRFGMGQIKGELEDLSFPYVYPKEYEETKTLLKRKSHENQTYLEKVYRALHKEFIKKDIHPIKTDYRIKHLYSLYKKLKRYDMDIEKIYDLAALRIVMETESDCYKVLGTIHEMWSPLPGRIKDYIATPKPNGYQSLHTTIFTGDGGIAEIQIRTLEMHNEAEFGIASHLGFKEGVAQIRGQKLKKRLSWIERIVEWQKHVSESKEFLETLKMDFFKDRVFIFTPKGDVIDLPEDSTAVDFAYAIHSDIGDHMAGAKINERMASFDTKLKSGDKVEIITKKMARPSQKWLSSAKTTIARKHIKSALQQKS
ncbi:MAG: bifunctional (p)ppGpp synthetase/guanosine-3',5'-bis(diphosphate) 3'-pyrophosphohydrolase [Parcubacteria group bacterium]|nr:bifunctional (p)ppGpp synthetase/guanosine-3',5'-bis(diphosphate) 3'-pyrophosphohydrolase [Parcubacteria group bacterium]